MGFIQPREYDKVHDIWHQHLVLEFSINPCMKADKVAPKEIVHVYQTLCCWTIRIMIQTIYNSIYTREGRTSHNNLSWQKSLTLVSIPTTNSISINQFYIPSSHEKRNKDSFGYITLNHEQEKIKTRPKCWLIYIDLEKT